MYKNILILLIGLIAFNVSFAQGSQKFGFDLIEHLKRVDESTMVPLLVEGESTDLEEVITQFRGLIRLQIANLYSVEIPAKHVYSFSRSALVKNIEFSSSPGKALGDTMLTNINADSIIAISSPLKFKYSGKGVILGVIDSGIELDHDDFKDSIGNTRVLYLWDQKESFQPARPANNYNYGVEWTSYDINSNIATHDDNPQENGHGSNVTGAAASNGLATGNFKGVAPEVNIISVATDFNRPNWLQTVVEAVDYIFSKADSLGMPCVINASIGTYIGSHDGKDIAARMIDSLIKQKSGRSFVCAAGNAGSIPFHLQHTPNQDTAFTWFKSNMNQWSGLGGIYFELWSDTNDFKQVKFSIGADKHNNGNYSFRGRTAFDSIQNRLNVIHDDSILNKQGKRIALIKTYAEENEGRYKLEVAIIQPDSADYFYRLETIGSGKLDLWSSYSLVGHSDMVQQNLPSSIQFPSIINYQKPDSIQSMVSSFSCLPSVITVGNYTNRASYIDVSNTLRTIPVVPGDISINSSLGPNRNGIQKPDLSSAGDYMFSAGRLATINEAIISNPSKVSQDSLHFRNGGTSMASPTVAGLIALYFEMCPNTNYSQIKSDLIQTAKSDSHTSNLPNNKWGHGKADGFQFLKQKVFQANISGLKNACTGDTILIKGVNSNYSYHWNTNVKSDELNVTTKGTYFAWASDSSGCLALTDSIQVNFNPLPPKPSISQTGNKLLISEKGNYQWFKNSNEIPNETDSVLTINSSGLYHCSLSDSNNCYINSDTLSVIITDLKNNSELDAVIFPNPTSGVLNFQLQKSRTIHLLEVYNVEGKEVYRNNNLGNKQRFQIDLSHLSKGFYYLKINFQNSSSEFKLMVE